MPARSRSSASPTRPRRTFAERTRYTRSASCRRSTRSSPDSPKRSSRCSKSSGSDWSPTLPRARVPHRRREAPRRIRRRRLPPALPVVGTEQLRRSLGSAGRPRSRPADPRDHSRPRLGSHLLPESTTCSGVAWRTEQELAGQVSLDLRGPAAIECARCVSWSALKALGPSAIQPRRHLTGSRSRAPRLPGLQ
jgi:hypothetical protein